MMAGRRQKGFRAAVVAALALLGGCAQRSADVAPAIGAASAVHAAPVTEPGMRTPDQSTTDAAEAPGSAAAAQGADRVLRVCADPNNLPFSNTRGEGFENRIATLLAEELGATVEYTWWAQRRGFIRNTLKAGTCDVVMGLPHRFEMALTTAPYYRSSYVFVHRSGHRPAIASFDDPALRTLKIGVQLTGDDYTNTPPAHALGRRNIVSNVVGYTVYGDYREDNPPARIIDALARGEIDVAVVWGPLAGFFAQRQPLPMVVTPVAPRQEAAFLPMAFDISLGVRHGNHALRAELDAALVRRRAEIRQVLANYGVPQIDAGAVAEATP